MLESANLVLQSSVTMDLPAQMTSATRLLVCASILSKRARNQALLANAVNLQDVNSPTARRSKLGRALEGPLSLTS
jgi:hypothetical protein